MLNTLGQHSGHHHHGPERFDGLEKLVQNALVATSGGCASGAAAAVEAAVRRAHCKGRILGHLDSSLIDTAIDEVSCEITTLQDAAAANAAAMRQMLPKSSGVEGKRGGSDTPSSRWERSTSNRTIPGDLQSAVQAAGGPSEKSAAATSSTATVITEGSAAGKDDLESTGATPAPWETGENVEGKALSAASIVAPLRQLAREMMVDEEEVFIDTKGLQQKLRLSRPKSGDLKMAREVDFDECASPRTSFDAASGRSSRRMDSTSEELEGVGGGVGSPVGSPLTKARNFLMGSSPSGRVHFKGESGHPHSPGTFTSAAAALGGLSPHNAGGRGGTGQILTLRGDSRTSGASNPVGAAREKGGGRVGPGPSPLGGGPGLPICKDEAPPGLEPTARVEGSCMRGVEAEEGEGMLASAGAVSTNESGSGALEVAELAEGVHRQLQV